MRPQRIAVAEFGECFERAQDIIRLKCNHRIHNLRRSQLPVGVLGEAAGNEVPDVAVIQRSQIGFEAGEFDLRPMLPRAHEVRHR